MTRIERSGSANESADGAWRSTVFVGVAEPPLVGARAYVLCMRILHTSDWHIGRTFHGVDLLSDQRRVLGEIAQLVAQQRIDVVVIPGDIFDRAIPSGGAIETCNAAFEAIHRAGAVIIATSGNHDSAVRLGAGATFAAAGGLHVLTKIGTISEPVMLSDEHGPVAFFGLPYLEPEVCRGELGCPEARSHADVASAAMDIVRRERGVRDGVRSVVLAHAFVTGAEACGSERSIAVGGVETVPASVFHGVDYVALGHLHSPQTVAPGVRYSGSPLPYSAGERVKRKSVWIVDLDATGLSSVEQHDLSVVRAISEISGTLAELLADPAYADAVDNYVFAVLTDSTRPLDAMRKLQQRFPHAVHIRWDPPTVPLAGTYRQRLRGKSDLDVARRFFRDTRSPATAAEEAWLIRAFAAVRVDSADKVGGLDAEASPHEAARFEATG